MLGVYLAEGEAEFVVEENVSICLWFLLTGREHGAAAATRHTSRRVQEIAFVALIVLKSYECRFLRYG